MTARTTRRLVALAAAATVVVAGCQSDTDTPSPDATSSGASARPTTVSPPNVESDESGPESPLGYGLEVPSGATQLGPLTRIRSQELITAYAPDLLAAQQQRFANQRQRLADAVAEAEDNGDPTPTRPTPTPDARPSDDSFSLIDSSPRPDTVLSVMRIDGNPTQVVRRMLAQLDAMLPDADVPTRLSSICDVDDRRITGCRLGVRGTTRDDRDVRVIFTVDPGEVDSRTSAPQAQRRPVMTMQISYLGDPRQGQASRETDDIGDVADIDDQPDPDGLIWPSMDEDAPLDTPLVDDFVVPEDAKILISGFSPPFVELTTARAATADELAEGWVQDRADGEVDKDVVQDLNEVTTTYSGTGKDDTFYRASYVLSARGNYVLLMVYPPGFSH